MKVKYVEVNEGKNVKDNEGKRWLSQLRNRCWGQCRERWDNEEKYVEDNKIKEVEDNGERRWWGQCRKNMLKAMKNKIKKYFVSQMSDQTQTSHLLLFASTEFDIN